VKFATKMRGFRGLRSLHRALSGPSPLGRARQLHPLLAPLPPPLAPLPPPGSGALSAPGRGGSGTAARDALGAGFAKDLMGLCAF
jgi:hypothetical protein